MFDLPEILNEGSKINIKEFLGRDQAEIKFANTQNFCNMEENFKGMDMELPVFSEYPNSSKMI